MLKILIVGVSHVRGGIESLFYNLFKDKCDFAKIDFLSFGEKCAFSEIYEQNGYNVFVLPTRKSNVFLFNRRVKQFFKAHADYDYVWVNTSSTSMYQCQKYAKRYTSAKVITHSHGIRCERTSGLLVHIGNLLLAKLNYRKVVRNTDLFFCCSIEAGVVLFGKKYKDRLVLIKNSIEVERCAFHSANRTTLRKQIGVDDDTTVVALIGRLSAIKNPIKGIRVFKAFNDLQKNSVLLVMGDGELKEAVEDEINRLKISSSVHVMGFRTDVGEWLSAIDMLLLPSLGEGLPLALVEAQCAGVTCFASDVVTKQIVISPLINFLSIKDRDELWAQAMLSHDQKVKNREEFVEYVKRSGFDHISLLKEVEGILCKEANLRID